MDEERDQRFHLVDSDTVCEIPHCLGTAGTGPHLDRHLDEVLA